MRSESDSDEQCLKELSKSDDDTPNFHKKSKVSYTRNVLFSLAELDACKRLPSGLDESSLGELGMCSTGSLHSYHYSDSGMFHSYLPLHLCLNRECGLLGSGASPKVSYVSGASDPVAKGSSYHLPNRSNEAYRPPHICESKVQHRAENEDLYNNETFGSSEYPSQERAEEERRRRDSFELMRKEQSKGFQEKQNKITNEHKENLVPENSLLTEACGTGKRCINKYNESDECATTVRTSSSTFLLPSVLNIRSLTKSITDTFISEPYDSKRDHIKGYGLHYSGLDDPYLGEKKPASGISSGYVKGGFPEYAPQHEVTKNCKKLPSGRNELVQSLMASTTSSAIDEISEKLNNWNKQNVTALVLPHEHYELPMLPYLDEHYSTKHHSVKSWSTNHRNGMHPNPAADHGASQHLALEKNGLRHQTDADSSSNVNRESLDKLCSPEIEGSSKVSRATESYFIQRDSVGMLPRNDIFKYHRFPFPCGHKTYLIPSEVDESGTFKVNWEGIMSSSYTKQTVACKTEENLSILDDIHAKRINVTSEPEGKLSPVSDCYEDVDSIDGLCLPDEDSLITVDDCIRPPESTSISAGHLFKANLSTSSSQFDVANKEAGPNPFLGDKRSTELGLQNPVFDSYDLTGFLTSYANLHTRQYSPSFGHYQGIPARVNFNSSDAQQVRMMSSNSKTNFYTPQPLQAFPSNVLADHFQQPRPDLKSFGPLNSPLPQQLPVPNNIPHHQVHGFPRLSPSPRPLDGMASYGQELYPHNIFRYHYQQPNYGGFRMPNSDGRPGQALPLAMAGRDSGSFGN